MKILLIQITRIEKKVCKAFQIKNLGEYHDLYVQNDTLLGDTFDNFQNMCFEIYALDPARFLTAPDFALQADFKNTKTKLDLLTDIDVIIDVINGRKRYQRRNISLYLSICKS